MVLMSTVLLVLICMRTNMMKLTILDIKSGFFSEKAGYFSNFFLALKFRV